MVLASAVTLSLAAVDTVAFTLFGGLFALFCLCSACQRQARERCANQ
jgi:hypothetical protein